MPTLPPLPDGPVADPAPAVQQASNVSDVISTMIENLADNGYHTGAALVVATIAVVGMLNVKVHRLVLAPVAVGAFWAGWLGWNTVTGEDHPLFPGDVARLKWSSVDARARRTG